MGDVVFRHLVEHRYTCFPTWSYTVIASLLLASRHTLEYRLGLGVSKKTHVKDTRQITLFDESITIFHESNKPFI
jgi:hypothetical protein